MDSRTKILDGPAAALRVAQWRAAGLDVQTAAASFDPLLAPSARDLAARKRPGARLLVLLDEPPEALLSLRARSEMTAALRAVDAVAPLAAALAAGLPTPELDLRAAHQDLRASFLDHVVQRMS